VHGVSLALKHDANTYTTVHNRWAAREGVSAGVDRRARGVWVLREEHGLGLVSCFLQISPLFLFVSL
jgi:hypothetical protein